MAASYGIDAVIDAVFEELAPLGCQLGRGTSVPAEYKKPPSIYWVKSGGGQSKRAARVGGWTDPVLQEDFHDAEIHVWCATGSDVERLRHALIQTVRKVVSLRNYEDKGFEWVSEENARTVRGVAMVVNLTIYLQAPKVLIPDAGGPSAIVPETYPTAVVELELPSAGSSHDGYLDSNEG